MIIDRNELDHVVASLVVATLDTGGSCLPASCYTSPSFHEFERSSVFETSWLGLGRVEQLAGPGSYFTIDVCGEPLVVIRGHDDEIRVLSNVCTHRHHVILEGSGTVDRYLRCPLHSWAFDPTGRLARASGMSGVEGFDKEGCNLPSLRVEIWNGFIFANHDPDAAPLAPSLAGVAEIAEPYGLEELVTTEPIVGGPFPWNWKTMFENGIEPFHTHFLHKGRHDFASKAGFAPFDDDDNAIWHPTFFDEADQSFNPLWRGVLEPLPGLDDEHRRQVVFVALMPTLYFGLMPDHVFWMLILPNGPGECILHNGILHHPTARELPNFEERIELIVDGLNRLFAEDSAANTAVQRGRSSRYAVPGPYAHEEATLPQVNRWLARRYRDGYDRLVRRTPSDDGVAVSIGATT